MEQATKNILNNKKKPPLRRVNNRFYVGKPLAITLLLLPLLSAPVLAENYYYRNTKLHPTPQTRILPSQTQKETLSATYHNQEKIEELNLKLQASEKEVATVKREMKELKQTLKRFKNFYFRRF